MVNALAAPGVNTDMFKKEMSFELTKELIGSLVGGAIWINYFRKSVRVKNTFTNGMDSYQNI